MARLSSGVLEEPRKLGSAGILMGILTRPAEQGGLARPVFVFLNAGLLHRVGASRMNVWLARELAVEGIASVRFDLSGLGDSEAASSRLGFTERSVQEIREVMDEVELEGIGDRFVPVGLCSGADLAFAVGLRDVRVSGIVAIDGHAFRTWRFWLNHYRNRLLRAESWRNVLSGGGLVGDLLRTDARNRPTGSDREGKGGDEASSMVEVLRRRIPSRDEVAEGYRELVERGVHLLQLFTGGLEDFYNYRGQFLDALHDVDFRDRLTLEYLPDADHTFTGLESQEALLRLVRRWTVTKVRSPEGEEAGTGSSR